MHQHIPPGCRFCGDKNEEFAHLAYDCAALYWDQHNTEAEVPDSYRKWTPSQIVSFTFIPKIDDAFTKPLYDIDEDRNELESDDNQVPDQQDNTPNDHLSEESLMDIESIPPSSDKEYNTEYEQMEEETDYERV